MADQNPNQDPGREIAADHGVNVIKSSGKTVEEAIQRGLAQLNLTESQVHIRVLEEGKKGILGIGARDAEVEIQPRIVEEPDEDVDASLRSTETSADSSVSTDPIEEDIDTRTAVDQSLEAAAVQDDQSSIDPAELNASADDFRGVVDDDQDEQGSYDPDDGQVSIAQVVAESVQHRAQEVLETLLVKMGVEADVTTRAGYDLVEDGEDPPLILDITGNDLGLLIGRRGETLQSLQFVVRQILNKEQGQWVPVVVDVESYLVRRRKSLKQLADRMADKVAFSKRKITLEPMPAQERRIIHLKLRQHEHVYTRSVGDGERRKVIILPK